MKEIITNDIKKKIEEMRTNGISYRKISEDLGLNYNTLISYTFRENRAGKKPKLVCEKCGKEQMDLQARYCSYCGAKIMTPKQKAINTLEKEILGGICDFPCNHRDQMRDAVLSVIDYIKKEVPDER